MRTNVSFRFAAEFIGAEESEDILGVNGVDWFLERLQRVPQLSFAPELIQEDWGVVVFAKRRRKSFWIGVSIFGDGTWIAHVHHRSGAFLQRMLPSGRRELDALAKDLHAVLAADPAFTDIRWYHERDLRRAPHAWKTQPEEA